MQNLKGLYNKKGLVTMKLARELLNYKIGDRIDTVGSYSEKFNSSRGIVQQSFLVLEHEKAIAREKRGTLGTFLNMIDYKRLWEYAGWGTLAGVSPLPYTKQHEGLATGIYCEMENGDIPFHFAYMQGAINRAKGLAENKYNFAVISKSSALNILEENKELNILMEFEPFTFLSGYVLLFKDIKYKDKETIKVGIDPNSPDHVHLIKETFKDKNIKLVNTLYTRMVPEIIYGNIDVTIYNKDTLANPLILGNVKFEELKLSKEAEDGTRAVILVNENDYGIANILKEIIHIDNVTEIMNEVIEGKRIPIY